MLLFGQFKIYCNFKYLDSYIYRVLFTKYKLFIHNIFFLTNSLLFCINKLLLNKYSIDIYVKPNKLISVLLFLKNHSNYKFKLLQDIICLDFPNNLKRFYLVYSLLSVKYNVRYNVIVNINELQPVFSSVLLYRSAGWLERECWDMMGIFFFGNNDLRRILTDYGFNGHPLRKDFPLSGFFEVYFDDITKILKKVPITLAQEFRSIYTSKPIWS